ncbi:hypothetical protein [Pedobacter caeni]|uniref:Lipoprotein n=1 Tax=Pedobacter caeni TaxID=288992 RepID=A0A1M4TSP1_9SPHI|nr:hypothetical protein [Pedobacter caeni]SHE47426.1 hypothetical protein SAMN04488522_101303 [Pedobacter caeni]
MTKNTISGIFLLITLNVAISGCKNGKDTKQVIGKEAKNHPPQIKHQTILINTIKLNQSIDKILQAFDLTKNDNSNSEYNLNLAYEEFSFPLSGNFKYNELNLGKLNSLVVYYLKDSNSAFSYELELENNPNQELLIKELNKSLGKPAFYKKLENTKEHPIFLNENGEQETQHIIEESLKWNDSQNKSALFVIHKKNLTGNTNKLSLIVVYSESKMFDEWMKFRSLDMTFIK